MRKETLCALLLALGLIFLSGCMRPWPPGGGPSGGEGDAGLANPASEHCVASGGRLVIVSDASGERGVCEFPNGAKCDEWAFYRGECSPDAPQSGSEEEHAQGQAGGASAEGFCGWSTEASCSADSDCTRGGCNSQICQAKAEGILMSSCDKPCYRPEPYGLKCGCVDGKCKWH